MTKEEKQLLLKDLCARLPYGLKVKCEKYPFPVTVLYAGNIDEVKFKETGGIENIHIIKPYLRPMSSMTEEEKEKIREQAHKYDTEVLKNAFKEKKLDGTAITHYAADWCNEHHFDYRGLIPMGLALEAPEGMYKTE